MHVEMKPFYSIGSEQEYQEAYKKSVDNPSQFWGDIAETFVWKKKWDKVLEYNFDEPNIKWFQGGQLNITENCLDRHLEQRGNKLALIWEPNDPKEQFVRYTYRELHAKVCQVANVLKKNGVGKGDKVCLYLPMIPELLISALACARIGAVHSVVFAGFSAQALAGRVDDAKPKLVITADGMYRGSKEIPVKRIVDEALDEHCEHQVETVLVVERTNWLVHMKPGRGKVLSAELEGVSNECPAEPMDAEDPLFILYTSGSTGKPKGILHTCGGYMVYADYSFRNVFQLDENDIFWCTADIGWITGHTYLTYGPMLAGATSMMFEGIPTFPDASRFWQIIDKYGVNQFYTAPTAIRALMAMGEDHVLPYNLHSLKLIGSVGEPINQEAWEWYNVFVGKERCPVIDTWWQTETGGTMISDLGAIGGQRPTYAGRPLPGIQPVLLDQEGKEIEGDNVEGYLCIKHPWPSMLRTVYGDHERCKNTYFANYSGYYFTGDSARRDDGLIRIIGRVDDVINVSGHRLGTAELENAINFHENLVESAVVGFPHEIKGEGILAFVVVADGAEDVSNKMIRLETTEMLVEHIGAIAKPDKTVIVNGLPKTRSGKIMRRILRKIAHGEADQIGDTSTLLDPDIVDHIIEQFNAPEE